MRNPDVLWEEAAGNHAGGPFSVGCKAASPQGMTSRLALTVASLLLLTACGDTQPATVNESVSDSGLEQEEVVAGDVTAIDAATADDAAMANDMAPPVPEGEGNNNSSNTASNAA